MPLTLEPGLLVAGKYRLERLIGRGGMGEVWAAEQNVTRQRVALKFLLADDQKKESTRKRFLREARAACAVSHPNVVQVHDVIEVEDGTPALVMELLLGETLEARLMRDGKLTAEETVAVILRVVSAVGTAHAQGVVHRDLKPDNIFLVETPDGTDVKVVDFGIAKIAGPNAGEQTAALTATNAMLGTPYYMSPEQAFGEKRIDHRTDIWSLGVVMYRCLTGELPTAADNLGQILKIIMTRSIPKLSQIAPQLPRELTEIVDSMLAYEPDQRPRDLREVKSVLEHIHRMDVGEFGPAAIDLQTAPDTLAATSGPTPNDAPLRKQRVAPSSLALAAAGLFALVTAAVIVNKRLPKTAPDENVRVSAEAIATSSEQTQPQPSEATSSGAARAPDIGTETRAEVTPGISAEAAPTATQNGASRARAASKSTPTPASAAPATTTVGPSPATASSLGGIVARPGF